MKISKLNLLFMRGKIIPREIVNALIIEWKGISKLHKQIGTAPILRLKMSSIFTNPELLLLSNRLVKWVNITRKILIFTYTNVRLEILRGNQKSIHKITSNSEDRDNNWTITTNYLSRFWRCVCYRCMIIKK